MGAGSVDDCHLERGVLVDHLNRCAHVLRDEQGEREGVGKVKHHFNPKSLVTIRGHPSHGPRPFAAALHVVPIFDLDDLAVIGKPEVEKKNLLGFYGDVPAAVEVEVAVPSPSVWGPKEVVSFASELLLKSLADLDEGGTVLF